MTNLVSFSLVILALLLAIPVAVFFLEVMAAILMPQRDDQVPKYSRQRVAVLIPAHNESAALLPTIANVQAQLHASDRLVVVADNCTDDTASVAAAAGAVLTVRNDPDRRGKGYALAWGIRYLEADPPDVLIVLDADCRLAEDSVERLAAACASTGRPVQALDLMVAPKESSANLRVVEFAWRVKNWVRPLGLKAVGLPCQLMGTGMAFPWDVIRSADLASGSIVEDLKLGLELTVAGQAPLFCPAARVTSDFPTSSDGVQSQRRRWEEGHLGMILSKAPRFLIMAFARGNLNALALTLDLAVPPLSLLGMLLLTMSAVAGVATLFGSSSAAFLISTANLAAFIVGVCACWLKYGLDILPPQAISLAASYALGKLPIYGQMLFSKSRGQWVRTDRSSTGGKGHAAGRIDQPD